MKQPNASRQADGMRALGSIIGRGVAAIVAVASVMTISVIAAGYGGSAAAAEAASMNLPKAEAISLAGRWSGPRYASSVRPEKNDCRGSRCVLTYDIVACDKGWCGIAVTDEKPCGAIGLLLSADHAKNRSNAFNGKLELAKGAAPYTVEAWFSPADGSGRAHLNFIGDTGPELLLMRRSFPFQAELSRVGDATCTLDKATS